MPEIYVREMVVDWLGASRAYTGSWNMATWIDANGPKMRLHSKTLERVDAELYRLGYFTTDNCPWSYMAGEKTKALHLA